MMEKYILGKIVNTEKEERILNSDLDGVKTKKE
jgi:hypothetical protein